jgi:hypothetical protein
MEHLKEKYLRFRSVSVEPEVNEDRLSEDLTRYLALAGELGVSAAAIVDHESWYLDPRVTLKCAVPRCRNLRQLSAPYPQRHGNSRHHRPLSQGYPAALAV